MHLGDGESRYRFLVFPTCLMVDIFCCWIIYSQKQFVNAADWERDSS